MMGMMGMDPFGPYAWIHNLQMVVGAVGQISQMLGMNFQSLQQAFGSLLGLLESCGGMISEVFGSQRPRLRGPQGQDMGPISDEDEKQRQKRLKLVRFVLGLVGGGIVSSMVLRDAP